MYDHDFNLWNDINIDYERLGWDKCVLVRINTINNLKLARDLLICLDKLVKIRYTKRFLFICSSMLNVSTLRKFLFICNCYKIKY